MFMMDEVVAFLDGVLGGPRADVLLVNPPLGVECGVREDPVELSPAIGLGYLATIADNQGLRSAVIESEMLRCDVPQTVKLIQSYAPRVVGFGVITPVVGVVRAIVDALPTPRPLLVAGGIHATTMPEHTIDGIGPLDILVRGEAEDVWGTLCRHHFDIEQAGPELAEHADISRYRATTVITVRRPPNPSSIPELNHRKFAKFGLLRNDPKYEFTVLGARGCTFRCRFCAAAAFRAHRVQYREIGSILKEIETCVGLGGRAFHLLDDNTLGTRRRVLEFSRELAALHLPVQWRTFARADQLDDELAGSLRAAGCRRLTFGIESGSPRTLERMNKRMKIEAATQAAQLCRKHGIRSKAFFIMGYPGETEEDFKATIQLACAARFDNVQFNLARAFPGTALFEELRNSGFGLDELLEYLNVRAVAPDGTPSSEQKTQYCVVNGRSICPPYSHKELARWIGIAYDAVRFGASPLNSGHRDR
jgi:radical SAM superfamily enzyme YgiQ (UPF0313 family)